MVASSILQSIQQLVSRMNDPLNPLVITVGKVTAGNRWNVLAGHATLEGTVRTFLTGTQVEDALRKVAECTAAAFGAKEKYDVDETILHRGAAVAAQFAADYLAETAQQ